MSASDLDLFSADEDIGDKFDRIKNLATLGVVANSGSCTGPSDCQSGCCVEECAEECSSPYCTESRGLFELPVGGPCRTYQETCNNVLNELFTG